MNIKIKEVVARTGVLNTLEKILKEKMLNFSTVKDFSGFSVEFLTTFKQIYQRSRLINIINDSHGLKVG